MTALGWAMTKETLLISGVLAAASLLMGACTSRTATDQATVMPSVRNGARALTGDDRVLIGLDGDTLGLLRLEAAQWAERLGDEAYYILREDGTERAFTSELLGEKRTGMFVCAGCELPLFSSATKFKSGTGWPSFYEPVRADHMLELRDESYGMVRTEVRCARCDGHQGHVFPDGPPPTGLRYCINGDALEFVAGAERLPQP